MSWTYGVGARPPDTEIPLLKKMKLAFRLSQRWWSSLTLEVGCRREGRPGRAPAGCRRGGDQRVKALLE
eukprot:4878157-Prymnesium_polylepis.3